MMIGTYTCNDETHNFNFATDISAYRKMMFVDYVVNSIVDENRYNSIVRDMIFDFGIVAIFTDINTSFVNVKDDDGNAINPIIFIEQFLEETNVVDIVKANMKIGLFEELNKAVNNSIEYRTGIHTNPLGEALASLLSTLERKINEIDLGNAMDMVQKFANMTGEFTPDSIVKAYIESGANKKNFADVEDIKNVGNE